ncbi:MAG: hypothetical protein HQ567_29110 [Candidatus Nealsonbacteria bacterium]|nr:hypothetical protein [Candidatus Nealsonbacteria bacterium]
MADPLVASQHGRFFPKKSNEVATRFAEKVSVPPAMNGTVRIGTLTQ